MTDVEIVSTIIRHFFLDGFLPRGVADQLSDACEDNGLYDQAAELRRGWVFVELCWGGEGGWRLEPTDGCKAEGRVDRLIGEIEGRP